MNSLRRHLAWGTMALIAASVCQSAMADPPPSRPANFQTDQLVAWCIVPFDARRRDPAQRAEMVKRLGLQRVAYDWRAEHVASFETEIQQYQQHGIEFFAFWNWHDSLPPLIEKYQIRPQIWVTVPSPDADSDAQRLAEATESLLPLVQQTRQLGLQLGLYNHGGWGGQPENLVAVCRALRQQHHGDHVGIVYNFHHAHDQITRFDAAFDLVHPYLLCLNLNGMADADSVTGDTNKILPIGAGKHETNMIRHVIAEGYRGPIGILDHRNEVDSEVALRQNLQGLDDLFAPQR